MQEGTKFWYGADKKYLSHGGKGAKWFELTGAELKNYDSMTFTIIPASGPVRKSRIRSAAVALVSHGGASIAEHWVADDFPGAPDAVEAGTRHDRCGQGDLGNCRPGLG